MRLDFHLHFILIHVIQNINWTKRAPQMSEVNMTIKGAYVYLDFSKIQN